MFLRGHRPCPVRHPRLIRHANDEGGGSGEDRMGAARCPRFLRQESSAEKWVGPLAPCSADEVRDAVAEATARQRRVVRENSRAGARSMNQWNIGRRGGARRDRARASARRARAHRLASRARTLASFMVEVGAWHCCAVALPQGVPLHKQRWGVLKPSLPKNTKTRSPHLRQAVLQVPLSRTQFFTTPWFAVSHLFRDILMNWVCFSELNLRCFAPWFVLRRYVQHQLFSMPIYLFRQTETPHPSRSIAFWFSVHWVFWCFPRTSTRRVMRDLCGKQSRLEVPLTHGTCAPMTQLMNVSIFMCVCVCGARELSMISTIVKPLSAQKCCCINQIPCVSRCPPTAGASALAPRDQGGGSTAIRAARSRSVVGTSYLLCGRSRRIFFVLLGLAM